MENSQISLFNELPSEMLLSFCTFLKPKDLAISSLVCRLWQTIAQVELNKYKRAEFTVRYLIMKHLMYVLPNPSEDEILLENEILKELSLPFSNFNISSEDFLYFRKKKKDSDSFSLKKVCQKVTNIFHKKSLCRRVESSVNYYGTHFGKINEAFYILNFQDLVFDQYHNYAIECLETPKWLGYFNCKNFDNYLEEASKNSKLILISREICEKEENIEKLKKTLPDCVNKNFFIFSTKPNVSSTFCVMQKFFEIFNNVNRIFSLATRRLNLTDEDAYYIALLIKKNLDNPMTGEDAFFLVQCIMYEEHQITSKGIKFLADALQELIESLPLFYFNFSAIRNDLNSEGLDLLKSLQSDNEDCRIVVIEMTES